MHLSAFLPRWKTICLLSHTPYLFLDASSYGYFDRARLFGERSLHRVNRAEPK